VFDPHMATDALRAPERTRLDQLWSYDVVDTLPDPHLDDLVKLAARLCQARGSTISLVDAQRVWFKAKVGSSLTEVNRQGSFCDAVVTTRMPLIVRDATLDLRFATNPHVQGGQSLRAYAGFPLATPAGAVLGSFCVMDVKPRDWTEGELEVVRILAYQTVVQLELHKAYVEVKRLWEQNRELEARWYAVEEFDQRRLATELHDGLGQDLAGISFIATAALGQCKDPWLGADLKQIEVLLRGAVQSCRRLARGQHSFASMPLGLRESLGRHVDTVNEIGVMHCALEWPDTIDLRDRRVTYNLYRIAEEAIANALHHSSGSSVVVRVERRGGHVCLEIADDGRGLGPAAYPEPGVGLETMRYRANLIGARLEFIARKPHGLLVRCTVFSSAADDVLEQS
jgi:signal transduction histidine kinase